ncbi:hypothetical protein K1T71_008173 [Dendrolimus kikuchii]|uniref:Uncharacterized protein n=1 Tax=Dendrolimus kikuchii TaxID=765133 RepID=A0ACC1CWB8_9NEOP|nr:hypothetical protein K1T71_008173 [Dendrolimus kikuchii]
MRRRDEKFPDNGFEAWGGYMQAKIAKLEEQYKSAAGTDILSNIFNNVSIYVNGFTSPSADELKSLMVKHGGVYHTYRKSDDFIIASNLPDTKVKNMSLAKVVKPEWITESIAANRLLNYKDYLLYKNSKTQPQINFNQVVKSEKLNSNITICNTQNTNANNTDITNTEQETQVVEMTIRKSDKESVSKENFHEQNDCSIDTKPVKQPQLGTKTAVDPNFISEFYNNSRLHHISQLGACFKQHVNDLREKGIFNFPALNYLKERILALNRSNSSQLLFEKGKIIMHIDMDCFFVSVGLRTRPELRGKAVAVTHSKGGNPRPKRPGVDRNAEFNLYRQKQAQKFAKATGVPHGDTEFESRVDNITDEDDIYGSMSEIASCSYEARAKGITNGMFMGAALKLCPNLETIPYDFEGYKEVAFTLYNTIAQYTLDIEAVSCDEMYVDCTKILKELNINVQDFATVLREEIKIKTGCPCSTGFGGNRLQARLATKKAKPDGQYFLTADLVEDFMYEIKLNDLPGVGRQTAQKLESLGHSTCGSLQALSLASLKCHLGIKTGAQLFDQCRGRDRNPLTYHTVRKSVSAEVNYGIRFENLEQCLKFLEQLSAELHSRMLQFKVLGKCITLKLMVRAEYAPMETAKFMGHGFCNVINKSVSLNTATNNMEVITREVISLCKKQNIDPKEMRGIGIQITKLEPTVSKPILGAMNKFLNNIPNKNGSKLVNNRNDHEETKLNINIVESMLKTEIVNIQTRSPKKIKVNISPIKKSPPKSPILKRRGRPSKNQKGHQLTSKNLMNKFLQGQNVIKDTPYKNPMIKEVAETPSLSQQVKDEKLEGLLGLPWDKVRELLRAWLDSGQTPLPLDVNLITVYMKEMVLNKNLEKLNILINFLQRRSIELASKEWLEVFDHIVKQVQDAMISMYGKKLYINSSPFL